MAIFAILMFVSIARASDLSWSGTYRFEGVRIDDPDLNDKKRDKNYMLHHLVLQPKMVAADGVTIYSRFDLFNNGTFGNNNQLGQFFGDGVRQGTAATATTGAGDSNVLSQNQNSEMLAVTQLYVQWAQEFGSLVVGRAPVHFGLGITHNAGNGPFDHYFDTKDMVGYKVTTGNLYIMPMIAKSSEGSLGHEDDVNDYILHFQYENPETELALGIFAEWRFATVSGTDTPEGDNGGMGGAGASLASDYKHRLVNLYSTQRFGNFKFGLEAGLLNGDSGINTAAGNAVRLNGYGIAGELAYQKPDGRWDAAVRFGVASGDNPGTDDSYEGFIFDRNYDVAFMMFNHPLGLGDTLRTRLATANTAAVGASASDMPDVEALSNAFYVSPRFNKRAGEKTAWGAAFTWAKAGEEAIANSGTGTDLGFELDLNWTYRPYERLLWSTDVGFLFPGDAWKAGNANAAFSDFAYGVVTKAAISF